MRRLFGRKAVLYLAAACVLAACVPLCQARTAPSADKQAQAAQKHAQKMQKKLSRFKAGSLIHLEFNNNTECTGKLLDLADSSFTLNNVETNAKETHNYSEVSNVEKGQEYIGKGSTSKKRGHIF